MFRVEVPDPRTVRGRGVSGFGVQDVGLTGRFMYESRDDTLMPSTGQLFDLSVTQHDDAIGSDYDYTQAKVKLLSFHQLHEKFVLGLRLQLSVVEGDPPFFGVPFVTLRGVPAMRYPGRRGPSSRDRGAIQHQFRLGADRVRWQGLDQ